VSSTAFSVPTHENELENGKLRVLSITSGKVTNQLKKSNTKS